MPARRRRFRSRPKPQVKKPPTNEEIKAPEVRLVGTAGEQLGVFSLADAVAKANETSTDMVMVAEKANPPVVRLMDIGKHMYEKRKKHAKQKKQSKLGEVKGVRIGFKIGEHDWNLRLAQAEQFLTEGHRVKLEIRLRGREKGRLEQAETKVHEFAKAIPGGARIEGTVGKSPRGLTALLTR